MSEKENLDLCDTCRSQLRITNTYMSFENDDTPELPTIAYTNLDLACANTECVKYAGEDLNNPTIIVRTVKHKVN